MKSGKHKSTQSLVTHGDARCFASATQCPPGTSCNKTVHLPSCEVALQCDVGSGCVAAKDDKYSGNDVETKAQQNHCYFHSPGQRQTLRTLEQSGHCEACAALDFTALLGRSLRSAQSRELVHRGLRLALALTFTAYERHAAACICTCTTRCPTW